MNIVMLSSEAAPYIKTGGLGDVLEGLPEDACTIRLWLIAENKEIAAVTKAEGETSVTIELTGKGEQTYMVFIGTDPYQEITINFDEYGN